MKDESKFKRPISEEKKQRNRERRLKKREIEKSRSTDENIANELGKTQQMLYRLFIKQKNRQKQLDELNTLIVSAKFHSKELEGWIKNYDDISKQLTIAYSFAKTLQMNIISQLERISPLEFTD